MYGKLHNEYGGNCSIGDISMNGVGGEGHGTPCPYGYDGYGLFRFWRAGHQFKHRLMDVHAVINHVAHDLTEGHFNLASGG